MKVGAPKKKKKQYFIITCNWHIENSLSIQGCICPSERLFSTQTLKVIKYNIVTRTMESKEGFACPLLLQQATYFLTVEMTNFDISEEFVQLSHKFIICVLTLLVWMASLGIRPVPPAVLVSDPLSYSHSCFICICPT